VVRHDFAIGPNDSCTFFEDNQSMWLVPFPTNCTLRIKQDMVITGFSNTNNAIAQFTTLGTMVFGPTETSQFSFSVSGDGGDSSMVCP
jgi:hypothetical protein